MKKRLKLFGVFLLLLIGLIASLPWVLSKPMPEGLPGPQADALAIKMQEALNDSVYANTRYLQWSYRGDANRYLWDKELGIVWVQWDENRVKLYLSNQNRSLAWVKQTPVSGKEKSKLVENARNMFNNDSFWLVAPYKVFDPGTQRRLVNWEGEEALLVTYTSGGTTPGDSYMWLLNDNGFPRSYRMWVNILPIGGLEASWDDWLITQTGTYLPKSHKIGPVTLFMGPVETYATEEDVPAFFW